MSVAIKDIKNLKNGTKVMITLTKSSISYGDNQIATVKALGLRRMHASRVIVIGDSLRGMIDTVSHLVTVDIIDEKAGE
jgi:large subunit ribosomal protein L30